MIKKHEYMSLRVLLAAGIQFCQLTLTFNILEVFQLLDGCHRVWMLLDDGEQPEAAQARH